MDNILEELDRLSYTHFIVLKHLFTAVTVAGAFSKEIVRLHGIPQSIISDQDRVFLSLLEWMFMLHGTTLKRSIVHHPQSDSQTEVVNRCLETYLHYFVSEKPCTSAQWVAWAKYWYNTSFRSSTRCTPFSSYIWSWSFSSLSLWAGYNSVSLVDQLLLDHDAILDNLCKHLLQAQQKINCK